MGITITPDPIPTKKVVITPDKPAEAFNGDTDPIVSNLRAATEALFPIVRPVALAASMTAPQIEGLQEMNPYKGKDPIATGLGVTSDVLGQIANISTPAKGVLGTAAKFALPAVMGVATKNIAEMAMKNKDVQEAITSPVGKIVTDYVLPGTSIVLSAGPAMQALKRLKPAPNVSTFLEENPNVGELMFPKDKIDAELKGNTLKQMKEQGYDWAEGKRLQTGEKLKKSIESGIKVEKDNFKLNYDSIKDIPVKKPEIAALVEKMKQAAKGLGQSREEMALKGDIEKYIGLFNQMKKPTVGTVDALKRSWYNDVASVKETFKGTFSDSVADFIGRETAGVVESPLSPSQVNNYQAAKASYKTMAEARDELDKIANSSAEQIMQKINTGDRIDALVRLANPEDINDAIKSTAAFKFKRDPAKMIEYYLDKVAEIESINPDLARKLFDPRKLPYPAKYIKSARLGNIPETVSAELNLADPEERKKIKVK